MQKYLVIKIGDNFTSVEAINFENGRDEYKGIKTAIDILLDLLCDARHVEMRKSDEQYKIDNVQGKVTIDLITRF
jgi:hypothetical protein